MDSYNFFDKDYNLSGAYPVINGVRITKKVDIVHEILEFIQNTCAQFPPYSGMPSLLRNYRDVSRYSLVSFFRRLLDQYSSGLVTRSSFVGVHGFTFSEVSSRLYHVTVFYEGSNKSVVHRLLQIQEIAPYISNLFDSQYKPSKVLVS